MYPVEKYNMTEQAPEKNKDPVSQLSFAYQRAETALNGEVSEALADGVRCAEAILFAAGEPLSAEQISEVLPQGVEAADVLMALRAIYVNRGVNLIEVAGKWRFQTAQDLSYLFVEERQVQKKLGQATMETLAIIAYGQPVTRAEVEAVRGVAVSKTTIDTLLESGWVKVRGRRKTPGQPMTYGTTDAFLEHFGLESLDTLPGKADLEAEGLLSDVIPAGFQMPDEEAINEEGMLVDDTGEVEESEAFVTDFLEDENEERSSASSPAEDTTQAEPETIPEADDEEEVVSVFSYTRAPERDAADDAEFDSGAIQAAVIRLADQPREPGQTMESRDDDE